MTHSRERVAVVSLAILALLATVEALYLGRRFLAPIALAVLLSALFRPIIRALRRVHMPAPLAAGLVVLGLLGTVTAIGFAISDPVRAWMADAPKRFEEAATKLQKFRKPFDRVQAVAKSVEHAAAAKPETAPASAPATGPSTSPSPTTEPAPANAAPPAPDAQPVAVQVSPAPVAEPSPLTRVTSSLLGTTTDLVGGVTEVLLLLYLLLASHGSFACKLEHTLKTSPQRAVAKEVLDESGSVVLRYLSLLALINAGQATLVALVMHWIGMPSPILWACLAFVLEFIPYLGALTMITLLAVTSLAVFESTGHILAAPGAYLLIATVQTNLVSPFTYGRNLKLHPVIVLLGVLFWWYVWGILGAFLAVPIMATIKVLADRIGPLHTVGELLGE